MVVRRASAGERGYRAGCSPDQRRCGRDPRRISQSIVWRGRTAARPLSAPATTRRDPGVPDARRLASMDPVASRRAPADRRPGRRGCESRRRGCRERRGRDDPDGSSTGHPGSARSGWRRRFAAVVGHWPGAGRNRQPVRSARLPPAHGWYPCVTRDARGLEKVVPAAPAHRRLRPRPKVTRRALREATEPATSSSSPRPPSTARRRTSSRAGGHRVRRRANDRTTVTDPSCRDRCRSVDLDG